MFCYEVNVPRSNVALNVWDWNANKVYLKHFQNLLFLDFMIENGSFAERAQAQRERLICERKMAFWKRHPKYEAVTLQPMIEKAITDWKRGGRRTA